MTDSPISIPDDDDEIKAAIAEAQHRLPEFRRIIEEDAHRIIPVYAGALAKVCVENENSDVIEHIWLEGIFFERGEIGGRVLTPPNDIPDISECAELRVSTSLISDWMYYEGDTMHGGFVERILMKRYKE
jgi:uncharacterized protein YegJ (DUF2314 family)